MYQWENVEWEIVMESRNYIERKEKKRKERKSRKYKNIIRRRFFVQYS